MLADRQEKRYFCRTPNVKTS